MELKRKQALESVQKQAASMAAPDIAAATLTSLENQEGFVGGLESILPLPVLQRMIDDFFTYIHPLAPLPHEPSFRESLNFKTQAHTPEFIALVASMIATLVGSFPRRPRLHLKEYNLTESFPTSMHLVRHCHKIAINARGTRCSNVEMITVYDAITSYFLGLAMAYSLEFAQARVHFSESLSYLRATGGTTRPTPEDSSTKNHINDELSRRLFWVTIVGSRSLQQLELGFDELWLPPQTPTNWYPYYPTEVDDEKIWNHQIRQDWQEDTSMITCFNLNVKLYDCLTPLCQFEGSYGVNQLVDWDRQKTILEETIQAV